MKLNKQKIERIKNKIYKVKEKICIQGFALMQIFLHFCSLLDER